MLIDNNLIFDSAAAVTTTRDSTNIIDLSVARDIGDGEDIEVLVLCSTPFTSTATTTTITAQIMVSTDNSTYTTAAKSDAIQIGQLTTGSEILNIQMPQRRILNPSVSGGGVGNDAYPRYIKLNYVASATLSAGAVTAALIGVRQTNPAAGYPSGFTVAN
jgi:hypothetical protein